MSLDRELVIDWQDVLAKAYHTEDVGKYSVSLQKKYTSLVIYYKLSTFTFNTFLTPSRVENKNSLEKISEPNVFFHKKREIGTRYHLLILLDYAEIFMGLPFPQVLQ